MDVTRARRDARAAVVAWIVALVLTSGLIALTHYESRDDDSHLYAGISARLSQLPVSQWIAPDWWGFWTLHGPYCEHPVGIFVLPAALGRLGYPPEQAAYAVNALWQVASVVLASLIAGYVLTRRDSRALAWLLQFLPIAFVFRVRANHEYAVLAGVLFAVYAAERARTRSAWTVGMVAGFVLVLLVKGVFAIIVPVACALWLFARTDPTDARRGWPAWAALAAMPVVGLFVTWAYETAYLDVTGRSFLAVYRSRQLPEGALTGGSPLVRTAYSAAWYTARVIWYAFPWSLMAAVLAVRGVRTGGIWPWARPVEGASRAGGATQADAAERARARQGAWFAIATGLALTGAFSLAHRKADRYIFAVYFIVAAAGAIEAIGRYEWLRRLVARLDRPWVPAAIFFALFLLRLVTLGSLPEFTFWRS
jgi:4-amino-4-deoxy-L-arabinose transferase-like glycosyltransferase